MIREGKEMPVGFYSRKLKDAQTRYSAMEVECLAIVKSIVIGNRFTIETNHRALQFLQSARHLNGRLTRWALKLQTYSFNVRYRPGQRHIKMQTAYPDRSGLMEKRIKTWSPWTN